MDKLNYLGDRDPELRIAFSAQGAVVTAKGWLPILCIVIGAVVTTLLIAH